MFLVEVRSAADDICRYDCGELLADFCHLYVIWSICIQAVSYLIGAHVDRVIVLPNSYLKAHCTIKWV